MKDLGEEEGPVVQNVIPYLCFRRKPTRADPPKIFRGQLTVELGGCTVVRNGV